jgi:hypothetical protein
MAKRIVLETNGLPSGRATTGSSSDGGIVIGKGTELADIIGEGTEPADKNACETEELNNLVKMLKLETSTDVGAADEGEEAHDPELIDEIKHGNTTHNGGAGIGYFREDAYDPKAPLSPPTSHDGSDDVPDEITRDDNSSIASPVTNIPGVLKAIEGDERSEDGTISPTAPTTPISDGQMTEEETPSDAHDDPRIRAGVRAVRSAQRGVGARSGTPPFDCDVTSSAPSASGAGEPVRIGG